MTHVDPIGYAMNLIADGWDTARAAAAVGLTVGEVRAAAEAHATPSEQVSTLSDPRRRSWWTAADLMATDFPEPRWAVRDVIADGLTLFAGSPKVGKSWLALSVGIAVASGGKVLSAFEAEQGEVLYLALEDHPRRLKDRLTKLLCGQAAPRSLTIATQWNAEHLDEWLGRRNKRLLVIDVLAMVRAASPPGVPQYEADYSTMRKIKAMADEHELAVVAIHHTRKMGAADFLDQVSGTNGLAGGADAVMVLKRMRGGADAELHLTGRDVAEQEYALKFDQDFGVWTKLDGRPADYKLSDTRAEILRYLHENPGSKPAQVADALGLDRANVRQTLRRMVEDGQADDMGKGLYMAVTPVTESLDDGQE